MTALIYDSDCTKYHHRIHTFESFMVAARPPRLFGQKHFRFCFEQFSHRFCYIVGVYCVMFAGGLFHHYFHRHQCRRLRRCRWRRCQRKNVVSSLKLRWKLTTNCCSSRPQPLPSNSNNNNCRIRRSIKPDPRLLVIRIIPRLDSLSPTLACRIPSTRNSLSCIKRTLDYWLRTCFIVTSPCISVSTVVQFLNPRVTFNVVFRAADIND